MHDVTEDGEAGFSLVESLVGIMLVTIAVFALMAELTNYVHHQANERARTNAVRYMSSSLEAARSLPAATVAQIPVGTVNVAPKTIGGVTFTTTETLQRCLVTDPVNTCTQTDVGSPGLDTRVRITVSWPDGKVTRSVTTSSSLADESTGTYTPTGTGSLSTLIGGAPQSNGVTINAFGAVGSSVTVGSDGHPLGPVQLTLSASGLSSSVTSVPVTWTDDNGSHQVTLTGGPSSFTVSIPASSITKAVTGSGTQRFVATVPGTSSLVTADVTFKQAVTIGGCSVTVSPVVLTPLTRKTSLVETLACTTTGLAASDTVSVAYTSGTSTATKALSSSNGTAWSVALPAATLLANTGATETFTFTATRASDSATASSAVSAVLA